MVKINFHFDNIQDIKKFNRMFKKKVSESFIKILI